MEHAELETEKGEAIDYSTPQEQKFLEDGDPLCKIMGHEIGL
jgi:hypothetical protein